MKNIIVFLILTGFFVTKLNAQVTIGDLTPPHESAVLEIKTDDKGFLGPQVELKSTLDTETIPNAQIGLMVLNTKDSDPDEVIAISERVRAYKYYYWEGTRWVQIVGRQLLATNIEEALATIGIPRPAIFLLDGTDQIFLDPYPDMRGVVNLLKDVSANSSAYLPMREHVNYTGGVVKMNTIGTDNKKQCTIIFQPGIYNISFVYEFIPANKAQPPVETNDKCTGSSYFMEFPVTIEDDNGNMITGSTRVESNNSQMVDPRIPNKGDFSDHGNTINYVAVLLDETEWEVKLGTGYQGTDGDTCEGSTGFSLPNRSTCLFITRIGDAY